MSAVEPYRGVPEPQRFIELPISGEGPPKGDNIDFSELIAAFRRRLGLFTIAFVVTLALVVVYLLVTPPRYTGTARVTIDARAVKTVPDQQTPVVAQLPPGTGSVDTEVQVIQSRRVVERVIERLHLDKDPEFVRGQPGLRGRIIKAFSSIFAPVLATSRHEEVIDAVAASLSPERYLTTGAIDINFNDTDPVKAQRIANAFAQAYLDDQVDAKVRESQRAAMGVLAQVDKMRRQADDDFAKVQSYKIAHNLLDVGAETLTEQEISAYNQSVAAAKAEADGDLANLHTAQEQLAAGSNGEDVGEALDSRVVVELRSQRATLSAKLADLQAHYGPKYPDLAQARQQLAAVDSEVQAEIQRNISNLAAKATVSQKRLASLEGTLTQAKGTLAGNNAAMIGLQNLTRAATVSQSIYEAYLDRYKETAAQAAAQVPDAEIVSLSDLPENPSFPIWWLFLGLGGVAGVLFGCATVLVAELVDTRLTSAEDIEQRFGRPYLGGIPLLSSVSKTKQLSATDAVVKEPLSPYSEALRSLRVAVSFALPGAEPSVVLITSALPQEGKTTVALGLARTSALQGVSTVLVDCDVRRRGVTKSLKIDAHRPGLLQVLSGEAALTDALVLDEPSGAMVLPITGHMRPADQLLSGEAMDQLLLVLRDRFHTVLLDAAPVVPIAVTRILASKADAVVLACRWRKTSEADFRTALRLLPRDQVRLAGVVLTKIDVRQMAYVSLGEPGRYFKKYRQYYG